MSLDFTKTLSSHSAGTAPPARHAGRPAVPRLPGRRSCAPPATSGAARGPSAQAAHGLQQQLPPALVQRAMAVQFRAGQGRVGLVLTFQLPPTAGQDPLTHRRRGLPGGPSSSSGPPAAGADAGRCGPAGRDAARVARHLVRRAGAGRTGARASRRARVHGRDQLEAGRKARRAHGPRDQHPAGFQRLAQRFQRAPVEFGQFIQKQHAVMRQADLSRPGWVPPPTSAGTDRNDAAPGMAAAQRAPAHGRPAPPRPRPPAPAGATAAATGPATAAPACSCPPWAHHQQRSPAAATSSAAAPPAGHARRTGRHGRRSGQGAGTASGRACAPVMCAATSARLRADSTRRPGTQAPPARRAGRARVGLIARHAQRDQQRRRDRRQRRSATARPPGPGAPAWTRTPAWRMACRPRRLRMEAPATAPMPAAAPARSAGRSGPIPRAGRPATG